MKEKNVKSDKKKNEVLNSRMKEGVVKQSVLFHLPSGSLEFGLRGEECDHVILSGPEQTASL